MATCIATRPAIDYGAAMRVIDYAQVLQQTSADGLRCVYPNSGAFSPRGEHQIVGWLGPDDPTIRPDLPATIHRVPEPYAANLSDRLIATWDVAFPQPIWLLPKSHWAYELEHAHQTWLVEILTEFGIDVSSLARHTNAPAIEFPIADSGLLRRLVGLLLTHLKTSDYAILIPGRAVVVTLHHHQQIWWQTADTDLLSQLNAK